MKTRADILKSQGYWMAMLQVGLYRQINTFMTTRHMNKTQLAEYLGYTKGYVSQLLNGDFDHKLSKLIELSLAMGKIPEITYQDIGEYIESDRSNYHTTISFRQSDFYVGQLSDETAA